MKPWSARTRKDKATRLVASVVAIVWLTVGGRAFVADVYDYTVSGPCRDGIEAAFVAYVAESEAIPRDDLATAFRAESVALMRMHDAIAALTCPGFVEPHRADFLTAIRSTADLLDGYASGASYSPVTEQAAYNEAGKQLTILREVLAP